MQPLAIAQTGPVPDILPALEAFVELLFTGKDSEENERRLLD